MTQATRTCSLLVAVLTVSVLAVTGPACRSSQPSSSTPGASSQAAEAGAGTGDTRPVATYDDHELTAQQFLDLARELPARSRRALQESDKRKMFVENRVMQDLVFEKGRAQGYDQDPTIRKQLRDLERRLVIQKVMLEHQGGPVTEEEIREFYDTHKQDFSTDRVRASHILVKDRAEAEKVLAEIKKDPSKFAELAKEHSIDKSNAQKGGDLGFFGKGRMVKEFEDAVFALENDGDMSDLVETRFGFHIIKRTGREDGHIRPFDEVKNQIRIRLANDRRREGTEKFLAEIKREANLQIDREVLDSLAIPQSKSAGASTAGAQ